MAKPVVDQLGKDSGGGQVTTFNTTSITTTTDDEIITMQISQLRTSVQSSVTSVTQIGTATVGAFTKLAEFASADHLSSVWWAHQTVKGTVILTVNTSQTVAAVGDSSTWNVTTFTGAKADQTGAAQANTNYAAATVSPTGAVTTTAPDSWVAGVWTNTATTGGAFNNGTNTAQDDFNTEATNPRALAFSHYTAATTTAAAYTQQWTGYNGTTEFIGQVLAYEVLAYVAPAAGQPLIRQARMGSN